MAKQGFESIFRPSLFEGKVALITGGGTGIGRCIAHELAALGATVVIVGRRDEVLQQTVQELRESGGNADAFVLNVREDEDVDRVVREVVAKHGGIDALVNNAGGQFASPASMLRPKGWRAVIETNLTGTFLVSQAVFNHSMSSRGGGIVNIVADMWNGFPGMAHTGAARAGVVNLTKTLSIEWAPFGVRVNSVAPGYILSSGLSNYPPEVQRMAAEIMPKNPSSRIGTESEVSAAVTFLLSPAAAFITGDTLRVDGGASLQKAPLVPAMPHEKSQPFNGFHLETQLPELFKK